MGVICRICVFVSANGGGATKVDMRMAGLALGEVVVERGACKRRQHRGQRGKGEQPSETAGLMPGARRDCVHVMSEFESFAAGSLPRLLRVIENLHCALI